MHPADACPRPTLAGRVARVAAGAALLATVAVAFADSSIVVLALPDLLAQFDVSIGSVAWVVTSYNLVLAVAALALVRLAPRLGARRLGLAGALAFLGASLACAVAPEIWSLIAFRAVQGLGAAMLLVGALPLVRRPALWAGASVVGAALGPALGGFLTQTFSWRAIFVAQAPVAALGLAAVLGLRDRSAARGAALAAGRRGRVAANVALALVSAALVGLLFLAVIELVDVRLLSPLRAGAVVSAVAVATLLAQPIARSQLRGATAAGIVLLAGGLAGMAFVPSGEVAWVVAALALGGAGYGIAVPRLTRSALGGGGSASDGALNVWTRHAGLVAGLLVVTPLLTSDLTAAGERAELRGISLVLDAPLPAREKLRLAIDLAPILSRPPRKGLPDFADELADEGSPALTAIGRALDETVRATVGRGFRRSFLVAGLFALLALAAVAPLRRPLASRTLGAALATVAALLVAELAAGAGAYGARPRLVPPCGERSPPPSGLLGALDRVACGLDTTREQLVADLARRGVDAVELVQQVERSAGRLSRLRDWVGSRLRALAGRS